MSTILCLILNLIDIYAYLKISDTNPKYEEAVKISERTNNLREKLANPGINSPPLGSASIPNTSPPTGSAPTPEFLGSLALNTLSPEYKKEGTDWSAIFNPSLKRVLDVDLKHTLNHERHVLTFFN